MAAMLQTSGPITVHRVLVRHYKFLNMLSPDQYLKMGTDLEGLGLGRMVQVGARSQVFIKALPDVAALILQGHPDLCIPDYYAERYSKTLSKSVSLYVRQQLSSQRLVPSKLLM